MKRNILIIVAGVTLVVSIVLSSVSVSQGCQAETTIEQTLIKAGEGTVKGAVNR